MKKLLIKLLIIVSSLAILAWLVFDALKTENGRQAFDTMIKSPKHWDFLIGAFILMGAAIVLTLIRWCYLVRAMGIALSMKDAMRIGFLGYWFNFAPVGIVGGDLVKAVMLAHEHPGNKAKSLASVLIDRVVGIYVLFVVASAGILLTGFYWQDTVAGVHVTCQITLLLTLVGTVGIAVVLASPVLESRWVHSLTRLRRTGPAMGSLIEAMRMYRRNRSVLLLSAVLTVGVHCLLTVGMWMIACGLPGVVQPLHTYFVIYPISSIAGIAPLPAGPFEAVFVSLCTHADAALVVSKGQALVLALVYRVITILLAIVGLFYYLGSRREVAEVMHEVQEEEAVGQSPWSEVVKELDKPS